MDLLPRTPTSVALSCAGLWAAIRLLQMVAKGRKYGAHQYILISEDTMWRNLLPSSMYIPGIGYGNNRLFHIKFGEFLRAGKDAYIQVSMTSSRPNVFLADPQAIKMVALQRSLYTKDVEMIAMATGMYGQHVGGVEGDDWKRHRKANQRAFNEKNIQLVWSETEDVMKRLFEIWDRFGTEVRVGNAADMTEKLALLVISTAAFGRRVSWDPEEDEVPEGHQMSFQRALRIASSGLVLQMFIPSWAANLTQKTKDITTAFSEFGLHLKEMIAARRKGAQIDSATEQNTPLAFSSPDSLFNIMMAASNTEEGEKLLEDSEVAGNSFVFLFAGHETTAHALAFALGLLAVHTGIQEEVYAQIKQTMGSRDKLEYPDFNNLSLVAGVFWEALRMYPVVAQINKIATEDSVVSVARNGPGTNENTREDFFIPKDAVIWFSITGTHYNPKYWPEPESFRPSRFLEPHNKDAFIAFSIGHRSCIGRKFAETEGVAALAMFLARYEVSVDEERFPFIPGESRKARETRLLKPSHEVTLSPTKLPLVFKRR